MGEGERAKGRRTYVYRLLVAHPPEAFKGGVPAFYSDGSPMLDWNWEPPGWDEDAANELGPDYDRLRWPVSRRRFLSHTSAKQRAALLEKYGAKVTIERSEPVTWPAIAKATSGEDGE